MALFCFADTYESKCAVALPTTTTTQKLFRFECAAAAVCEGHGLEAGERVMVVQSYIILNGIDVDIEFRGRRWSK